MFMNNSKLTKLIKEVIDEEEINNVIDAIKRDLLSMKTEDSKAYNNWKKRLINFGDDLRVDLRKAIQWNKID